MASSQFVCAIDAPWARNVVLAGAEEDCKTLIKKLIENPSAPFDDFLKIWNDMKFDTIYHGRESYMDLLEFTEGVLQIAKLFCLPPNDLPVQIGGVYLLYSLYYVQPTKKDNVPYVKIKVTLEELKFIQELMEQCKPNDYSKAAIMLGRMLCEDAFVFTGAPWPYCLHKTFRQYLNKKITYTDKSELLALKDSNFMKSFLEAYDTYSRLKKRVSEAESSAPENVVNYSNINFAELTKSMLK